MKPKRWRPVSEKHRVSPRRRGEFRFFDQERGAKGSQDGRALEARVEQILTHLQTEGVIPGFVAHKPNSPEDRLGFDFTVMGAIGTFSFGITSSWGSYKEYFRKHPGNECLKLSLEQTDEEIRGVLVPFISRNI